MSDPKEPSFFSKAFAWREGLNRYSNLFASAKSAKAIGEASTAYSNAVFYRGVPRRIAELLPDVRLIYIVRHPIERVISQYHYLSAIDPPLRSLDEAAVDERLLSESRYALQIEAYLKYFKRSQLLVLTTDALRTEPVETLQSAFEFIGVDQEWRSPDLGQVLNARGGIRSFSAIVWPGQIDPEKQILSIAVSRVMVERLRSDLMKLRSYLDTEGIASHLGEGFDYWSLI